MAGRGKRFVAAVLAAVTFVGVAAGGADAIPQPAYETMRISQDGEALPYAVWIDWAPTIIPMPDGGAWAFFSAQTKVVDAADPTQVTLGTRKLYASKFDPIVGVWAPATALPGGEIQFGASAVVDSQGTVHLVYTDRANADDGTFGVLTYARSAEGGGWSEPKAVAPDPAAGHQLSPELVLDGAGGIHVAWQDQRLVDEARRVENASNADVFAADLLPDGSWTTPVQINQRPDPTTNASRPQLAVDGDRLVVLWSVYDEANGLNTAAQVNWSTRPLGEPNGWTEAKGLIFRDGGQIGGRLLDVASDPNGGLALVFGRRTNENRLFVARLASGAAEWDQDPILVARGNSGSYPRVAVAPDSTVYVAYNVGSGQTVHVGAVAVSPGQPRGSVETVLTEGEEGAQGIPALAVDGAGKVWLCYLHEPVGGRANEVRVLRGAVISTELAPEPPAATPEPAASPIATPEA